MKRLSDRAIADSVLLALLVAFAIPTLADSCRTDTDCTTGHLCQCARHFDELNARCDELGGQCGLPVSEGQRALRTRASEQATTTRARMFGDSAESLGSESPSKF
ncbi:MAG: hypothetical protein AB7R40_25495 [Nitrospiraceae bacterium]